MPYEEGEEGETPEDVPKVLEPEVSPVETEPEWVERRFREVHGRLDNIAEAHLNHVKAHETVPEVESEVEQRPIEVVSVDVTPEEKEEEQREPAKRRHRL